MYDVTDGRSAVAELSGDGRVCLHAVPGSHQLQRLPRLLHRAQSLQPSASAHDVKEPAGQA